MPARTASVHTVARPQKMYRTLCIRVLLALACLLAARSATAQITRWNTGQVIPGTVGITPGPGVNLSGWNSDAHNLRYGQLSYDPAVLDLSGANFSGSWLDNASFGYTALANANLSGSVIKGANFGATTALGFTKDQLYTTASFLAQDLQGIWLGDNDLSGWDFSGQNLTSAY